MNASAGKQVLGIVGSPRRGGNTDILVDEVLRGAKEAGASVEKILLGRMDIGHCRACDHCRKTGACIQQDDMPELLKKMERSEIYVFGTPVYFMGPSAQLKTFIDRWYALGADGRKTMLKGRRVILTIPMENDSICMAHNTMGMLTEVISWGGMELFASVLAPDVEDRGAVRDHPEVLEAAYRAGRDAVIR